MTDYPCKVLIRNVRSGRRSPKHFWISRLREFGHLFREDNCAAGPARPFLILEKETLAPDYFCFFFYAKPDDVPTPHLTTTLFDTHPFTKERLLMLPVLQRHKLPIKGSGPQRITIWMSETWMNDTERYITKTLGDPAWLHRYLFPRNTPAVMRHQTYRDLNGNEMDTFLLFTRI